MESDVARIVVEESIQTPQVVSNDVAACVEHQEKLEDLVPKAIYAAVIGIPLLINLLHDGTVTFTALLSAGVCFILAKLAVWVARQAILFPLHNARYNRAAEKLKVRLQRSEDVSAGPFTWTLWAPGVMALSSSGEVLLNDRSTGYELLRIPASQIADVQVKRSSQVVTDTHQGGRTTFGGLGGSLGMAYTMGARSTSITRSVDSYVLEIRFQPQRNGHVRTAVIPGGGDHKVVEELCAMVRRLEPVTGRIDA